MPDLSTDINSSLTSSRSIRDRFSRFARLISEHASFRLYASNGYNEPIRAVALRYCGAENQPKPTPARVSRSCVPDEDSLRRVLRMLLLFVVVAYFALVMLALLSDRIIFQPHPSSYRLSDLAASSSVQPLILTSGQVNISAVYLPNVSARYTLLFSHGNAEDLGDDLPMLNELRRAGFAIFAYDYRGYGTSQGVSSETSLYEDVDAAYQYLRCTLHLSPDRIISFGRSLGCAAAIRLAATRSVAGLIVEAPFLSAFRVLTHVRLLPWEKFDNAANIRRVHRPVLVIHGRSDRVVPWSHGERIYELANEPKRYLWVDRAGHNDVLPFAARRYFAAINDFAGLLDSNQQVLR